MSLIALMTIFVNTLIGFAILLPKTSWSTSVYVFYNIFQVCLQLVSIAMPCVCMGLYCLLSKLLDSKPDCGISDCTKNAMCVSCLMTTNALKTVKKRLRVFFICLTFLSLSRALLTILNDVAQFFRGTVFNL